MSQQGERPAAHDDDWWRRLYDETAPDTGPSSTADSLDDRFDSASDAVGAAADRGGPARGQDPDPDGGDDPDEDPDPDGGADPDECSDPAVNPAVDAGPGAAQVLAGRKDAALPVPDPRLAGTPAAPPPARDVPQAPQRQQRSVPLPASPRTMEVRAPWEPPAGRPRPYTFAAPAPPPPPVPEAPGRAGVPEARTGDTRQSGGRTAVGHIGDRPPTYDAEPGALPAADGDLEGLVPDTVLDGARYGTCTLRAASVRGDSARFRGEPRKDALLTARFGAGEGALVLVAVAGGARTGERAHLAAADACRWIGGAVGRSHARLSDDIRAGRRGDLKSGLQRLTDRTYGKLRARAAELGLEPEAYTAGLRCLLLSADPACRTRVFFGVGGGGLFRLRDGVWQDLEPLVPESGPATGEPVVGFGSAPSDDARPDGAQPGDSPGEQGPDGDRLTMDLQITTPPSPYIEDPVPPPAEPFRFRASVARPGDTLLLCSSGLAEPMRGEPALSEELAVRWAQAGAPGLAGYLADIQLRVKGYADDRTSAAVWEA